MSTTITINTIWCWSVLMKLFRCWILKYQRSKENHKTDCSVILRDIIDQHSDTWSRGTDRWSQNNQRLSAHHHDKFGLVWTIKKSYMIDYWSSITFWTFPGCSCIFDKQQRESWGSFLRREPCKNSHTSAPAKERKHVFALRVNLTINNQLLQLWNIKMTLKPQALRFF